MDKWFHLIGLFRGALTFIEFQIVFVKDKNQRVSKTATNHTFVLLESTRSLSF